MFSLDSIEPANATWKPQKIIICGVQGLGKGTFGSTFEKPILVRTEDGAGALSIPTFPDMVEDFAGMEAVINTLHGEHDFKTLLIDSLDWMEPVVWAKQIEEEPLTDKDKPVTDIESYGYGKGFNKVLTWWRYLMGGFNSLRFNKNMEIVLISHTEIKRYDPPDSDPYDRYQIKLHKSAAALWQEWADMVLFCNYKTRIQKTDVGFNKTSNRGTGSGERVIFTEERPAYLAKNRWGLPPEIYIGQDKTWAAFHEALSLCTEGRYSVPSHFLPNKPNKKKEGKK